MGIEKGISDRYDDVVFAGKNYHANTSSNAEEASSPQAAELSAMTSMISRPADAPSKSKKTDPGPLAHEIAVDTLQGRAARIRLGERHHDPAQPDPDQALIHGRIRGAGAIGPPVVEEPARERERDSYRYIPARLARDHDPPRRRSRIPPGAFHFFCSFSSSFFFLLEIRAHEVADGREGDPQVAARELLPADADFHPRGALCPGALLRGLRDEGDGARGRRLRGHGQRADEQARRELDRGVRRGRGRGGVVRHERSDEIRQVGLGRGEQRADVPPEDRGRQAEGPVLRVVARALDVPALAHLPADDAPRARAADDGVRVVEDAPRGGDEPGLRRNPYRAQRPGHVPPEGRDVDAERPQRRDVPRDPGLGLRVLGARHDARRRAQLVVVGGAPRLLLGEQDAVEDAAPDRHGLAQGVGHPLPAPGRVDDDAAVVPADDGEQVQVQAPRAEVPLARVAVGALEVRRPGLGLRVDVPAAAPLVRDERAAERVGHLIDEVRVLSDRAQTVGYGQVRPLEVRQDAREVVVGLWREDQIRLGCHEGQSLQNMNEMGVGLTVNLIVRAAGDVSSFES